MIDIPLLDDDYQEAFLYLLDEIDRVRSCSDNKEQWFPNDEEKLEEALKVYRRWHPDPGKNPILDFPWPKPGSVPEVPTDILEPTDEDKEKIRNFIERNDGSDMDPFTGTIVQLAKDLMKEIH